MVPRRAILATPLLGLARQAQAQAQTQMQTLDKVHIGQATTAVSFLSVQAARALGAFPAAGLDLFWAAIPGGDPACLAALGRGDIELAAVGADTLLAAIGGGRPFQIVASLMNKVSLELVVSSALIESTGLAPADDPLERRLSVLKGARIGVSALGGAQDRAARWLARQAGLNPQTGIQVVDAGPPPAIRAALETGQIDAFLLSPPEGFLAEDARSGQVLVRMADDFPSLDKLPWLVLAARTPVAARPTIQACKALAAASTQLLADPAAVAARIGEALYPRLKPEAIAAAIDRLKPGIATRGRLEADGIATLLAYAGSAATGLDVNGKFWTNEYWDAAQ